MRLRRLARSTTTIAAAAAVAAGLGLTTAAAAGASTNLLPNGSFDSGSISGWKANYATLSLASGGYGGTAGAIQVAFSGGNTSYTLYATPRPATNVTAGTTLVGDGYVLGVSGKKICLLLQEHDSTGAGVQTVQQCETGTGAWQALPTVTLTDQNTGDSVGYMIRQYGAASGDSFLADSLTMSDGSTATTSPSPSPSPTTSTSSPSPTPTTASPTPTAASGTSLLSNGTFDTSTTGWKGGGGTLAEDTSNGWDGSTKAVGAAKVTWNGTATSYQMYTAPRPVTSTTAGEALTADGYVKAVSGRTVCLQLVEHNSANTVVQKQQSCALGTGAWQSIGPANLTATNAGDSVAVLVHAAKPQSGDYFEADTLSLTSGSGTTSPSPSPSPTGTTTATPTPTPTPTTSGTAAAIWHMDETSGTVMHDASGNANNGTIIGPVKINQTGHLGKSYFFPGSTGKGYVDVPASASLSPGINPIDISFWMHTSSVPAKGDFDLVRNGVYAVGSEEWKTELLSTGQVSCTFHGSSAEEFVQSTKVVSNGAWHHIECVETANSLTLYVDGALQQTLPTGVGTVDTSTQDATLGSHGTYDWYKGKLDEVVLTIG